MPVRETLCLQDKARAREGQGETLCPCIDSVYFLLITQKKDMSWKMLEGVHHPKTEILELSNFNSEKKITYRSVSHERLPRY